MLKPTREVFSEGERLEEMGLKLPQITKITQELRKAGIDLSPDILTVGQAFDEIAHLIKKEGKV